MHITGDMLKVVRGCAGHTQKDVAAATGYSLAMIAAVEQGHRRLSNQAVIRLMTVYDLDINRIEQVKQATDEYKRAGVI